MKNGKRLSLKEKRYLQSINLAYENWLISKKAMDEWILVHKLTGTKKIIPAP